MLFGTSYVKASYSLRLFFFTNDISRNMHVEHLISVLYIAIRNIQVTFCLCMSISVMCI